jgi:hypothetical protein
MAAAMAKAAEEARKRAELDQQIASHAPPPVPDPAVNNPQPAGG